MKYKENNSTEDNTKIDNTHDFALLLTCCNVFWPYTLLWNRRLRFKKIKITRDFCVRHELLIRLNFVREATARIKSKTILKTSSMLHEIILARICFWSRSCVTEKWFTMSFAPKNFLKDNEFKRKRHYISQRRGQGLCTHCDALFFLECIV